MLHSVVFDPWPSFKRMKIEEPDGVKVLTQIQEGEGNIPAKAQEEPAPDPGNGHSLFKKEELEGLDEQTKELAEEFAILLNSKTTLTPHLCRKRCKYYGSVGDPEAEVSGSSVRNRM